MSTRVCIIDSDLTPLRYHRIGRVSPDLTVWYTACGHELNRLWSISSIRRDRAEAMGATPCRRCFKDGDA